MTIVYVPIINYYVDCDGYNTIICGVYKNEIDATIELIKKLIKNDQISYQMFLDAIDDIDCCKDCYDDDKYVRDEFDQLLLDNIEKYNNKNITRNEFEQILLHIVTNKNCTLIDICERLGNSYCKFDKLKYEYDWNYKIDEHLLK